MHKTSEKIAKQKKVLTKAVLSSAKQLGLTLDQLAIVINLDSVETLNSLELDPDSSQGELAIMIYAELSGDFPLGDSRQPTYKSLRPFDLVS